MKKSDTFFLVHNYNTVPKELIEYCNDYLIIDCSDDGKTPDELKAAGYNFIHVENTGHNLTSYFHYFIDNYDNLPEHIALFPDYLLNPFLIISESPLHIPQLLLLIK